MKLSNTTWCYIKVMVNWETCRLPFKSLLCPTGLFQNRFLLSATHVAKRLWFIRLSGVTFRIDSNLISPNEGSRLFAFWKLVNVDGRCATCRMEKPTVRRHSLPCLWWNIAIQESIFERVVLWGVIQQPWSDKKLDECSFIDSSVHIRLFRNTKRQGVCNSTMYVHSHTDGDLFRFVGKRWFFRIEYVRKCIRVCFCEIV